MTKHFWVFFCLPINNKPDGNSRIHIVYTNVGNQILIDNRSKATQNSIHKSSLKIASVYIIS